MNERKSTSQKRLGVRGLRFPRTPKRFWEGDFLSFIFGGGVTENRGYGDCVTVSLCPLQSPMLTGIFNCSITVSRIFQESSISVPMQNAIKNPSLCLFSLHFTLKFAPMRHRPWPPEIVPPSFPREARKKRGVLEKCRPHRQRVLFRRRKVVLFYRRILLRRRCSSAVIFKALSDQFDISSCFFR